MKRLFFVLFILGFCCISTIHAQSSNGTKKNITVKEYNLKSGSKTTTLDHETRYDNLGRKVEETEYASYGQKSRVVYEYEGNSTLCHREVVYNDKNAVVKIKKIEYNPDGTKKRQLTYGPDGKLRNTRTYEYVQ